MHIYQLSRVEFGLGESVADTYDQTIERQAPLAAHGGAGREGVADLRRRSLDISNPDNAGIDLMFPWRTRIP